MALRKVFDNLINLVGQPLAGAKIRFKTKNLAIVAGGVMPKSTKEVYSDQTGYFEISLETGSDGTPATTHEVVLPDSTTREFALVAGDGSPIHLSTLIRAGLPPAPAESAPMYAEIAAQINAKSVRTDTAQILNPAQAAQARANLGVTSGFSYLHRQAVAANQWTINHNLGFEPNLELRTIGGAVFDAAILHVTSNQAIVYLDVPLAGSARCS